MENTTRNIFAILIFALTFASCRQNEVDEIFIGHTLYENLTNAKILELRQIIRQTLNKDRKSFSKLINFGCGDGAGCYDLGFIVTQIIYILGETDFMTIVAKLDMNEINRLESLISVGLEYGDNDKDGKIDGKTIESEFPKLFKQIKTIKHKDE